MMTEKQAARKLTKPQWEELKRLGKERQTTYGTHRARVQNNLVLAGFAQQVDEEGTVIPFLNPVLHMKNYSEYCEITPEGREKLATRTT